MIAAGKLNQRVTLRSRQSGTDAWGQPVEAWQDMATVWANVRFLSGVESVKAGAMTATAAGSVRIRARVVDAAMRLVIAGTVYEIVAVLPARDYVDLTIKAAP